MSLAKQITCIRSREGTHIHTHTRIDIQTLQPNCSQNAMRVQLNNEMIDKLQAAQYMRHVIEPT